MALSDYGFFKAPPKTPQQIAAEKEADDNYRAYKLMQYQAMVGYGGGGGGAGALPPGSFYSLDSISPPALDITKLEALKKSEPRKVLARMPDLVHPVKGWRAWTVTSDMKLAALGMSGIWEPKKAMESVCQKNSMSLGVHPMEHKAPAHNCECGLWAFSSLEKLQPALDGYKVTVLGEVALWGRIIECENGYRAQYGYPTELWLFDNELEQLGFIYGVPVRTA